MTTEKRAFKRHAISLDADVSGEGVAPLACVITDFCEGGLFLEPSTRTAERGLRRQVAQSPWLEVGFTDPVSGTRRKMVSRIARATSRGFGMAFQSPQPAIVSILLMVAAGDRTAASNELYAGGQRASLSAEQIRDNQAHVNKCAELITDFISNRLANFITQADAVLLRAADATRNDAEQNAVFAAIKALNGNKALLSHNLCGQLDRDWRQLGRFAITPDTPEANTPDELSLVNETAFEDWLGRSDIVSRAETRAIRRLRLLQRRLSELAGGPIDDYRNPVSPAVICHGFCQQFDDLDINHNNRLLIYPVLGKTVLNHLSVLYDAMNNTLRTGGVLPDLENEKLGPIRQADAGPGASHDSTAGNPAGNSPQAAPPRNPSGAMAQAERAEAAPQPAVPVAGQATGQDGIGQQQPSSPGGAVGGIYRSFRSLFRAQRQQSQSSVEQSSVDRSSVDRSSGKPAPGNQTAPDRVVQTAAPSAPADDPRPPAPDASLTRASAALRNDDTPDLPLTQRLSKALSSTFPDNPPQLNSAQTESVELLDQWFSELRPDSARQPFFKHWSERLKPLAMLEELRTGAVLDSRDHAVHRLVNALDLAVEIMAVSTDSERQKLQAQLTPVLERAVEHFDGRPETLAEAADAVEAALQRSQRALEAGMERVRQACEGAQRLEMAREAVEQALNQRMGGKLVPALVLQLLDQGWRNYLVLVELRQGTDCTDWMRGLRAVEILAAGLGSPDIPRRLPGAPDKLVRYVESQLLASNRPQGEVRQLIAEIERWLNRPADSQESPSSGRLPRPAVKPAAPDLPQEWLGRAKLLNIGDWLQLRDQDGTLEQIRLAWISRRRDRFVFVNRNGKKTADLGLEALASQLGNEEADADTDFNAPVTDRRAQEMLVNLNRQLVHTATHDPLTGLLNRRALQRRVHALMDRSRPEQEHVLIHIALDDFKVVNSALGHEGGDQALHQIGRLLLEGSGRRGLVGRLGGDEFAVLMVRCDGAEGAALAEKHLATIRKHRFGTGNKVIKVAASVGVVPFCRLSHSVEDVLRDSDDASSTAKKIGGNRVHVYSADDQELEDLRESMSRATLVDNALDAGLLALRCQRIQPLQSDSALSLYEVLITITSELGASIPPDDFIPAAERFGRMPALDRWVVREVLQWAARNPGRLRAIDALSINISGQTLNDVGFVDFLKAQFKETGVAPNKICLEVAETAAVANLSLVADLISQLKILGCRFALDDFGTGMSSYSYLKNMPADYLKIDGEFVRELDRPGADDTMVRSIHELARHLGKLTVGESVESHAVNERLRTMGIDFGQGFFLQRPTPLEELGLDPVIVK